MYSASDIAKIIICWCNYYKISITNLKLQKLLYFVQGEFFKLRGARLISDDFYAWQLGPVVPNVYYEYAIYSSAPIPGLQNYNSPIPRENYEDYAAIDWVLKKYAERATWELVDLSHLQDPWKYNHQIFGDKALIPFDDIAKYFREEQQS